MSTGVGGTTLDYFCFSPQPQNFAVREWLPEIRRDMFSRKKDPRTGYFRPRKFYRWIDERVPIDTRRNRPIPCTAEAHIRAARELGYVAGPCPAAILPPDFSQVNQWGTPIEGCAGCAHCPLGCRRPTAQPLHRKAKRTMQVAAITFAESLGTEVISDAHVTRITRDASGAADGVEYKRAGDSTTHTAKAHVVFLAGGAIESPRLYINSELPDPNPSQPQVGHWLTDHQEAFVVFFHDQLMRLWVGNVVGAYITNRTRKDRRDGIIATIGGTFPMMATEVMLHPQVDPDNLTAPHPTRPLVFGPELKRLMAMLPNANGSGTQTNDETIYENFITVSDSVADDFGPVAEIHYQLTPETMARHMRQVSRQIDIGRQAAGASTEIITDFPGKSGAHPMCTLRMGDSPSNSVCDPYNECHAVPRLYISDASCLPNGLGGSNPARTINAFASRAAYYAMKKYFPVRWANRTWPW